MEMLEAAFFRGIHENWSGIQAAHELPGVHRSICQDLPAGQSSVAFHSLLGDYDYLHFTDAETEASGGEETCPKSHSQGLVGLERNFGLCALILGSGFKVIRRLGIGRRFAREKGQEPQCKHSGP